MKHFCPNILSQLVSTLQTVHKLNMNDNHPFVAPTGMGVSEDSPPPEPCEHLASDHLMPGEVEEPKLSGASPDDQHLNPVIRSRSRFGLGHVFHNWWLELLCCVFILVAVLAIALTLGTHQGRSLSEWPYSLSINSLISIYAVVLKGAMLLVVAEGMLAI